MYRIQNGFISDVVFREREYIQRERAIPKVFKFLDKCEITGHCFVNLVYFQVFSTLYLKEAF